MPETASAMRLTAQARRTGALHIREPAEIAARATLSATPSRSGGKGGAIQLKGAKRVPRLGAGVAANVRRPLPKILLVSRSRDRRNETRRPLISLGYARLKPNPVGQQRLRSTIFPFGPRE